MRSNRKQKGNTSTSILLAPIKWVGANILLPFLPIAVKMVVNCFSTASATVWDPNDLLYYNFFICILLLDLLKKKDTIFSYVVSGIGYLICIIDILMIGFIATGQENFMRIQGFAIAVAIICACFGSIYVLVQGMLDSEKECENNG